MAVIEQRVDRIERVVEEFVANVGAEFNKLYDSHMRTEAELREFKDENRLQVRQMNIKWGEIAKKFGSITEDLVAPGIPRIVKEVFGLEVVDLMIRRKKKLADGRTKEYDAIAVAGEYVFVDSTRSTIDSDRVKEFNRRCKHDNRDWTVQSTPLIPRWRGTVRVHPFRQVSGDYGTFRFATGVP